MEQADTSTETVIRGWIGEARVEDQRRIGELTAQVQRLQTNERRGCKSSCDAASNEPPGRTAGKATSLPR